MSNLDDWVPDPLALPGAVADDDEFLDHFAHGLRALLSRLTMQIEDIERAAPVAASSSPPGPGALASGQPGDQARAALRQVRVLEALVTAGLNRLQGRDPAPTKPFDLGSFARCHGYSTGLAGRSSGLVVEIAAGVPPLLPIDGLAIELVLQNLIGNAFSHGGDRPVTIRFSREAANALAIRIRDHGPGLPTAVLCSEDAASGLGLMIVRAIVARLGGILTLSNPLDGGTLAEILLPLRTSAGTPWSPAAPFAGVTVLLAGPGAQPLAAIVADEGGRVVSVPDRGAALGALSAPPAPGLVIADGRMPELGALIRAAKTQAALPVLVVGADPVDPGLSELVAAGADRILFSALPSAAQLLAVAERLLAYAPDRPAPASAAPSQSLPDLSRFDPTPLLRVSELAGPEMAREILERLQEDLSTTGQRLSRAIGQMDLAEIRAACHVLIALSGTAGAGLLLQRSRELSRLVHAGELAPVPRLAEEVTLLIREAQSAIARLDPPPYRAS